MLKAERRVRAVGESLVLDLELNKNLLIAWLAHKLLQGFTQ